MGDYKGIIAYGENRETCSDNEFVRLAEMRDLDMRQMWTNMFFIDCGCLWRLTRKNSHLSDLARTNIGDYVCTSMSSIYEQHLGGVHSANCIIQTTSSVIQLYCKGPSFEESFGEQPYEHIEVPLLRQAKLDTEDRLSMVLLAEEEIGEALDPRVSYVRGARFIAGRGISKLFFTNDCVGIDASKPAVFWFAGKDISLHKNTDPLEYRGGYLYELPRFGEDIIDILHFECEGEVYCFVIVIASGALYTIYVDTTCSVNPLVVCKGFVPYVRNITNIVLEMAVDGTLSISQNFGRIQATSSYASGAKSATK